MQRSRTILVVLVSAVIAMLASAGVGQAQIEYSVISSVGDSVLGSVEVGKQGAPLAFTLSATNDGLDNVITVPPVLSGANAEDFTIARGTCVAGAPLGTAATCAAAVLFTPKSVGTKTAVVSATSAWPLTVLSTVGPACPWTRPVVPCSVSFTVTGSATAASAPAATAPTVAATLAPATRVILAGRTARLTVAATNSGTVALTDVITVLAIPVGFVAIDRDGGSAGNRTLTWTVGTIAAGGSAVHTVTLRAVGSRTRKGTFATMVTATGATAATAKATVTVQARPVRRPVRPEPVTG